MLIDYNSNFSDKYFDMTCEFYRSGAVLHTIPENNIHRTVKLLDSGSPFAKAYLIQSNDEIVGYVLLALTYSNEAGGEVVWIEELYVSPLYRGRGLARSTLREISDIYSDAARFRLEISPNNSVVRRLYEHCGFTTLDYAQMYSDRK